MSFGKVLIFLVLIAFLLFITDVDSRRRQQRPQRPRYQSSKIRQATTSTPRPTTPRTTTFRPTPPVTQLTRVNKVKQLLSSISLPKSSTLQKQVLTHGGFAKAQVDPANVELVEMFTPSNSEMSQANMDGIELVNPPIYPELIPEPQPILPSVNGFLIYRGIDWWIRDPTSEITFTNTCPVDFFITFIMIKGHTSKRFRTLVNSITQLTIKDAFTEIIALGGATDTSVKGLATRDNRLKVLWSQLVYDKDLKEKAQYTITSTTTTFDMKGGIENRVRDPLWSVSTIYIHHSCTCNPGTTNPDSTLQLSNIKPEQLLSFATKFEIPTRRTTKKCKDCKDPFNFERITVNRDNMFIFVGVFGTRTHKYTNYNEWPIELSVTDYDSYAAGSPFEVRYELACIIYEQIPDFNEHGITHAVALLRLNSYFYYYDDMQNQGRVQNLPKQYELDKLLKNQRIQYIIYVRK